MDLDVSRFDLGESANVEDWSLARERLELEGSDLRPLKAEPGCVTEHKAGDQQQQAIHHLDGEPLEQPHGQPESRATENLPRKNVHLVAIK